MSTEDNSQFLASISKEMIELATVNWDAITQKPLDKIVKMCYSRGVRQNNRKLCPYGTSPEG